MNGKREEMRPVIRLEQRIVDLSNGSGRSWYRLDGNRMKSQQEMLKKSYKQQQDEKNWFQKIRKFDDGRWITTTIIAEEFVEISLVRSRFEK